jgi:hypothetical protein
MQAARRADAGGHGLVVGDGGQIAPAELEVLEDSVVLRDRQREPRLADAPHADDRHEASLPQQPTELAPLGVAADQLGRRQRCTPHGQAVVADAGAIEQALLELHDGG